MTNSKVKSINYKSVILIVFLLLTILLIISFPKISMNSFYDGVRIWSIKVLPSLLPFFILTKLLSYTNFVPSIGKFLSPFTSKLYGVGGVSGYIYAMSIISGYPVGAKLTSDFYKNNLVTYSQATTITSFTSTSGPLFILGSVSIGLFNDTKMGIIILISHYLGAIINGLFYKNKSSSQILSINHVTSDNAINESMTSSIVSIMTVGGFIALFYMILNIMLHCNLFYPITTVLEIIGIDGQISNSILCGIIEVTSGCIYLSKINLSFILKTSILSFLIAFGGLSIHAQAYCYLKSFDLKYSHFLIQKITHAIISASVTFVILLF